MMKSGMDQEIFAQVRSKVWALLGRGVAHSRDPMHCVSLATDSAQGCQVRTVILRGADEKERTLTCFSDARAAKVGEIREHGHVQWLFYHPRKQIQLRISGPAAVHTDDRVADACWAQVNGFSRLNYCTEHPPGTPIDQPSSGLPARLVRQLSHLMHSDAGRSNFAAIVGIVDSIDWLRLSKTGNNRARFQWDNDRVKSFWVVP